MAKDNLSKTAITAMAIGCIVLLIIIVLMGNDLHTARTEVKQLKASIAAPVAPSPLKLDVDEGCGLHSIDLYFYGTKEAIVWVIGDNGLQHIEIPLSTLATVAPLVEEVKGLLKVKGD